jgi:hypothetical protein
LSRPPSGGGGLGPTRFTPRDGEWRSVHHYKRWGQQWGFKTLGEYSMIELHVITRLIRLRAESADAVEHARADAASGTGSHAVAHRLQARATAISQAIAVVCRRSAVRLAESRNYTAW